jgi:hypothetical protein
MNLEVFVALPDFNLEVFVALPDFMREELLVQMRGEERPVPVASSSTVVTAAKPESKKRKVRVRVRVRHIPPLSITTNLTMIHLPSYSSRTLNR